MTERLSTAYIYICNFLLLTWTSAITIWNLVEKKRLEHKGLELIFAKCHWIGKKYCNNVWFVIVSSSEASFCFCSCSWLSVSISLKAVGFGVFSLNLPGILFEGDYLSLTTESNPASSTGGEGSCLFDQLRESCTEADRLVSLCPKASVGYRITAVCNSEQTGGFSFNKLVLYSY